MISSIAWVPAGVADPNPKKYELSAVEEQLVQMMQEKGSLSDKIQVAVPPEAHDLPADLRMDEYESSDDDEAAAGLKIGKMLLGGETSYAADAMAADEGEEVDEDGDEADDDQSERSYDSDDNLDDVPDTREFVPTDVDGLQAMGLSQIGTNGAIDEDEPDDDSVLDDVRLTADDALICVAKTEDDFATLEVNVYDQKTGNLYVHHDIPLPTFPLCLAHGQVSTGGVTGNFCAVGSFEPGIEIWNLDVLNALEPSCILGGQDTSAADDLMAMQLMSKKTQVAPPRTSKEQGLRPGSHTDAVMSLSWNSIHKQVIASGSADTTVKIWDVTLAGSDNCNASTFTHHKGKVECVEWHPKEGTLLATGSYDRTVAILDARSGSADAKRVKLKSDCEALAWDPCHTEYLTAVGDDGKMTCWDVRKFETLSPVWSFSPSEFGGISGLAYNAHVPGMLATCSIDKTVTLWDAYAGKGKPAEKVIPQPCGSKDMCSGKLYTIAFYPSLPWLLGCGGSGNQLALWDISEEPFRKRFSAAETLPSQVEHSTAEDLQAMMTPRDQNKNASSSAASSKQKKAKGKKAKAHRKGR